jgi:hypothetical protein
MMICKNDESSLQKEERKKGRREGEREMNGRRVAEEQKRIYHQQKRIYI